jgi:hypothetical protein
LKICGNFAEILRNFAEFLRSVANLRSRFCRDLEKFAVKLRSQKNFAVIWLLEFNGILRKFCGLSQFCGHVLPGLRKITGQIEIAKKKFVPNGNFFSLHKSYIFELT